MGDPVKKVVGVYDRPPPKRGIPAGMAIAVGAAVAALALVAAVRHFAA